MCRFIQILGVIAAALSMSGQASARLWLYVSLLEQKQIVCFERDEASGKLTHVGETDCPAEPAFLNCSADGSTLFVSFRSTGELGSYQIDGETGTLKLLSVVPGGEDPAYLQPDQTGRFLAAAYYAASKVTVNRIEPSGSLGTPAVQSISTAARAHGIAFTSDNKWMLVPHTGANRIYSFHFDDQTGSLIPAEPPFLATPPSHEPRHIVLHRSDKWAYTSDEKGDSISMYSLRDGRLSPEQTLSTIPADFDGTQNSTARCVITPDGQFVYVANRGHDSIAGFSIDQSTGRLSPLGQLRTEKTPRSFAIDSASRFLYVAGQSSGRIAACRIQKDGRLGNIATYDAGPISWAVVAVDCNPKTGK